LVKAALSKICFDAQTNNTAKAQPNGGMRKMEKTFLFSDVFVVILLLGLVSGLPERRRRSQYCISEGKPAVALRIQDKGRDHAQTAATS
jgi:hypothetical protein